jgi:hypothetical protein
MIYYVVERGDAPYELVTTQADAKSRARECKCTWSQTDIPVDKEGLRAVIQDSFDRIYDLEQQISGSAPAEGLGRSQEQVSDTASESPASQQAEPSPQSAPDEESEDVLDVRVLEQQVSALGIAGVDGLEKFDGWSQTVGISSAFNQGVHLLNIVGSDDSQLAKIFLREQIKKRIQRRTY